MHGWVDGWMHAWMDGWMDIYATHSHSRRVQLHPFLRVILENVSGQAFIALLKHEVGRTNRRNDQLFCGGIGVEGQAAVRPSNN